ncbi:MAG: hypothetical protein U5R06_21540 [candidate division KSB1 bacterium]|nr:hypothetical protein [candidate division KSB1 bacterium]
MRLFNEWSGMTNQSRALRLLNSQTLKYDPDTPFIMTAPQMGMGHGHYVFRDDDTGEEVFQIYSRSRKTAYTEFGVPSPSGVGTIKKAIPDSELWPPRPDSSWTSHHGYNAWLGDTWLMQDFIESCFGASENLQQLVEHGQILQAEGLKCIFEEARRQKPYCAMALSWCFNEPWTTAANTSLIDYPLTPKPALDQVRQNCRPLLVSAKIPKFTWKPGEEFSCELWALNDRFQAAEIRRVTVSLIHDGEIETLTSWTPDRIKSNNNLRGPQVRCRLPNRKAGIFKLRLQVEGRPELNSEYRLVLKTENGHAGKQRETW